MAGFKPGPGAAGAMTGFAEGFNNALRMAMQLRQAEQQQAAENRRIDLAEQGQLFGMGQADREFQTGEERYQQGRLDRNIDQMQGQKNRASDRVFQAGQTAAEIKARLEAARIGAGPAGLKARTEAQSYEDQKKQEEELRMLYPEAYAAALANNPMFAGAPPQDKAQMIAIEQRRLYGGGGEIGQTMLPGAVPAAPLFSLPEAWLGAPDSARPAAPPRTVPDEWRRYNR